MLANPWVRWPDWLRKESRVHLGFQPRQSGFTISGTAVYWKTLRFTEATQDISHHRGQGFCNRGRNLPHQGQPQNHFPFGLTHIRQCGNSGIRVHLGLALFFHLSHLASVSSASPGVSIMGHLVAKNKTCIYFTAYGKQAGASKKSGLGKSDSQRPGNLRVTLHGVPCLLFSLSIWALLLDE